MAVANLPYRFKFMAGRAADGTGNGQMLPVRVVNSAGSTILDVTINVPNAATLPEVLGIARMQIDRALAAVSGGRLAVLDQLVTNAQLFDL